MTKSRDEQIDELLAEREILQLSHNYCRAQDRGNMELLASLYHDDALDEFGFNESDTVKEMIELTPPKRRSLREVQHNVTSHTVVIDGDKAEGEIYILAYHTLDSDEGVPVALAVGGRWFDKYERRDGKWKIAHRRHSHDWSIMVPVPPARQKELVGEMEAGALGPHDLSFDFFELPAFAFPEQC